MSSRIISLFCGCGGFDLGFKQAGFDVALALDKDAAAVKTYNHNNEGEKAKQCDLALISEEEFLSMVNGIAPVGVIGGPPCQPFSNGNNTRVKEDQVRKELPGKFATLLSALNKRNPVDFFVLENVRGITFEKHRQTFAGFKSLFEEAGFNLFDALLDAKDFGVPQTRPRVFVVGLNRAKFPEQEFKFPTPSAKAVKTVADAIKGLPPPAFYERQLSVNDIPSHVNHWTMRPKSPKFFNGFLVEGHNRGKSFKVLSWEKPSCTVAYGNREIHIHPSGQRRLSLYEAMLLQGFPSDYVLMGTLSDQVRLVSDAVPPPLALSLALSVRSSLPNIDPVDEVLCAAARA